MIEVLGLGRQVVAARLNDEFRAAGGLVNLDFAEEGIIEIELGLEHDETSPRRIPDQAIGERLMLERIPVQVSLGRFGRACKSIERTGEKI